MLLSQISVVGSLQLLGITLVSMLIGAGAMWLRQRCVSNRLRRFHRKYGAGYMQSEGSALPAGAPRIKPGGSGK